ncbi:MAG TPA: hypothetical protein PLV32_05330 [Chitinophagaceae bacterium]|nr:hypothetical protein [Chitinophagaceae bacterium]
MTIRIKALTVLAILLSSCNDEASTSENGAMQDTTKALELVKSDTVPTGCFIQINGKDTANLQLEAKANGVSGSLSYRIFEKDRNDGTVQADLAGDIIRGWYLFKSEGVVSVREVAWKVNGDELLPATGELTQRNDTTLFAKPDNLKFDNSQPFRKVPCVI